MLVCCLHSGDGYKVVRQRPEQHSREEIAKISLSQFPAPSWIHDFPITKNYAIVPETPVYFNMLVRISFWWLFLFSATRKQTTSFDICFKLDTV